MKEVGLKLLGVILSLLTSGGGLIYAGYYKRGIAWFLAIWLSGITIIYLLAVEWMNSLWVSGILLVVHILLHLAMLVDSYRVKGNGWWFQWVGLILAMLVLSQVLINCLPLFMRAYQIPTNAMYPTVWGVIDQRVGDHVMVMRSPLISDQYQRGDIVAFDTSDIDAIMISNRRRGITEGQIYMKRIAGLPGDTVQIDPPHLIINGERVTSPEIFQKQSTLEGDYPGYTGGQHYLATPEDKLTLGEDEYFMLGDNSPNSFDSRSWGVVKHDAIIGKITKRYWPLSRFGAID